VTVETDGDKCSFTSSRHEVILVKCFYWDETLVECQCLEIDCYDVGSWLHTFQSGSDCRCLERTYPAFPIHQAIHHCLATIRMFDDAAS
jgi:hypothetical protein